MSALVNIELYQSYKSASLSRFNFLVDQFLSRNELIVKYLEIFKDELNSNGVSQVIFPFEPNLEFYFFIRNLALYEEWFVLELCIEYDKVLENINRQTIYNKGIKDLFIKILKLLNESFETPAIVVTSEIENGFFFAYNFGNGSAELTGFEMALLKKSEIFKNVESYSIIEETEEYRIYIQENKWVAWQ